MAKAKHTYAVRLAVEGGNRVKADLRSVGASGERSIKKIDRASDKASRGLGTLSDRASALRRHMRLLGGAIAVAAVGRSLQQMVKLYADFETGLIGVGKTADLSGAELEALGKDIDELSKRMPVATDELLAIAQSAGQLGVKGSDNILKFTETVAKLGTATDLSGDQAAMALARILNVTGEALGTVDVLGSVIVALGNNFAATESQIAEMATEVARGAAVFGVSSAQASALAAALAAVGVKSEVAGTSIGRILRTIDAAIRSGGEHLAILTQITGRTAEEIKELFQRDAMAAFALFIDGLKRIGDAGGSVADAMAALGLADQRLLKTIPVLANRADLLAQALEIANRETENATALNEEAARAFASLNNQTEVMWNNIKSLARAIGADLAPGVSVAVQGLSDLASEAGDAYEKLKLIAEGDFNFEGLSLSATRRQVEDLREEMIELAREINAMPDITPPAFFEDPLDFLANIPARLVGADRESKMEELNEVVANWRQWKAKLEWELEQERKRREKRAAAETEDPSEGDPAKSPEDIAAAQERARRLLQIQKSLNQQLFQLRYQGADRIREEYRKLDNELKNLGKAGADPEMIERLRFGAAAVRDDKLAELARREDEIADRRAQANQRVAESLGFELEALRKTERQRFVDVALRRLSAEATPEQRKEVERLAGALHDEQRAIEARNEAEREANQLRDEGKALTERLRTAQEAYTAEIREYQKLLDAGAIDKETFARASEQADDRMLQSSREWSDGVRRAIRDYLDEATDAAKTFEQATTRALKASEDAFVEWAMTGKFSAKDLFNTIAEEALRAAYRMAVAAPLNNILGSIFGAIGGSIFGGTGIATTSSGTPMIGDFPVTSGPTAFAHGGGVIGRDAFPARMVDPRAFDTANRYHRGGIVGGEVPIVTRSGEGVFTPGQMQALAPVPDAKPVVHVAVNVRNTAPGARASADVRREPGGDLTLDIMIERIEGGMARHIGRGEGLAPTLERRYGLNPAAGSLR